MSATNRLQQARTGRPLVLCLHCSGGSGHQWRTLIEPLASQVEFRTPDLLGYGAARKWPTGAGVTLDDEAEHLLALMLNADSPVHLLGHSYGGAVALQVALRWPQRVASLTLYEPVRFALLAAAGIAGPDEAAQAAEARHQITSAANRFSLSVFSGRLLDAAESFVQYWGGPGTWSAMDPRRRQKQAAAMPKVQAEFQAVFADRVPASAYENLNMPVHLIGGTSSPLPARMVMRRLAARLPRVSTVSVVGLGHMGPIDSAERVRAHLPAWLRTVENPTSAAQQAMLEAA